uniref:Uncharacterized protein n=1 Tax=Erythroglossum lusitanicum TaxID=2575615 RepID=A0A4D6WTQ7_9FLOR|nr:hypothetical protein [Erythroglossum lusitanicum]
MDYNILLFRVYMIIAFSFLILLCIFISFELWKICKVNIIFRRYLNEISLINFSEDKFNTLVSLYIERKQWLIVISLLELFYYSNVFNIINLGNSLAYCYQKLSYTNIAEYYYLKILSIYPSDIYTLHNLAQLYDICSNYNKALKIYQKISNLDAYYIIPDNYKVISG